MKLTWIASCKTDKEKAAVKDSLGRARPAFELLKNIIDRKHSEAATAPDYDSPSWAFREADRHGYQRALSDIRSLIEDNS